MDILPQVQAVYQDYLDKITELEANRGIGDGIFGFGRGPADDPCNDQFLADLEALLADLAAEEPPSAAVAPVLSYIYAAPREHEALKTAYWMLIAAQGLTLALCRRLSPEDAGALHDRYAKTYRRHQRLPVQKQVLKALEEAAR